MCNAECASPAHFYDDAVIRERKAHESELRPARCGQSQESELCVAIGPAGCGSLRMGLYLYSLFPLYFIRFLINLCILLFIQLYFYPTLV